MNTLSSDTFDLHEQLEKCKTHSCRVISVSERLEETLHQISGIDPISELYLLSVTSNKLIRIWEEAAEALKLTSKDLLKLGLIDYIIQEPLGSAYRNYRETFSNVKKYTERTLKEFNKISLDELLKTRYEKLMNIGKISKI